MPRAQRAIAPVAALLCLALQACTPPPPSPAPQPRSLPRRSQASESPASNSIGTDRERRRSLPEASVPGSFDFYLLNLSWSPEFCATHTGRPECAQHLGFVLHGLWPQTNDGGHPEHCGDTPGPSDPSAFRDIYPDSGLLRHEWQVHGTCSGLAPEQFFNLARSALRAVVIPRQLATLDHQVSMPAAAILDLFTAANPSLERASLALSCGNNYLTAVEVCLGKDLRPIACRQVRSCRANAVRIPPPNGASQ